jgi:hypothetical protein
VEAKNAKSWCCSTVLLNMSLRLKVATTLKALSFHIFIIESRLPDEILSYEK